MAPTSGGTPAPGLGRRRSRPSRGGVGRAMSPSTSSMRPAARSPRPPTSADLATLDFSRVDQVAGPVCVDGAEPGDTLEVELLEFEPADWGWTASIPGFGLLADDFPDPACASRAWRGGVAEFLPGVRIPLAPFCGVLGRGAHRSSRGARSRPPRRAATWTPGT